jgi:AAA+ superfamily predicted ATPase
MATNRIEALDIQNRPLFTAIYGLNSSSEVYITSDMRVNNLWEVLYIYLKRQGYAVVFYDDKAFSYEEEPLIQFFKFTRNQSNQSSQPQKRDFFRGKGPMKSTRNMNSVSQNQSQQKADESHHDSIVVESEGNQSRFIVYQEEGFFKNVFSYSHHNPQSKLAIVFVTPATLKFEDKQRRTILNKWNELHQNLNRNSVGLRIIVLYSYESAKQFSDSFNSASDELFLLEPFKSLVLDDIGSVDSDISDGDISGKNKVAKVRTNTVFFLSGPGQDEINNVLQRRRLIEEGSLPHIFGKVKWDNIVLRLWQGEKQDDKELSLISDMLTCKNLDEIIMKMDTVKSIDRLNEMEGVDNIKDQFAKYRKALYVHRRGEGSGRFRPHMALMGSPGTGKTTVAKLFGDILREDGLLPKGHFVKVSTDELIGQYVGETRPKTRAVCERARGGVLFIDEAYGLMTGSNSHGDVDYGKEAIEVLIQFMEDNDDSLVILAGYTDEITRLIDEGNQGFRRRFNDLGFFYFQDYSPNVLYNISIKMIKVPMTDEFRKALRGIIQCKWAYRNKKFGNVGDMENLVNLITSHYRSLDTTEPLDIKHLPDDLRLLVDDSFLNSDVLLSDLNSIVGQDGVKVIVNRLLNKVVADKTRLRVINNYIPLMPNLNFLFTGNPGTGKTTIARIIGNLFQKLGIFPPTKGNVITEVTGSDLLYYSTSDINKLFEDNIGKVLFIDEAYQLRDKPKVLTDIVGNLTKEQFKDKLSVIMAGYPNDMRLMVDANSGLSSRFEEVSFTDYTNEQLYEILQSMVSSNAFTIMDTEECRELGLRCFASIPRDKNFSNARIAEKLLKLLCDNRDSRLKNASSEDILDPLFLQRILPCDFPNFRYAEDNQIMINPIENTHQERESVHSINCVVPSQDALVNTGSDIYSSVGLIESRGTIGTAFVISVTNRYIMTASHVVENHIDFTFTLNMQNVGCSTKAHLLWNHPNHDFAILEVDSLPLETKQFAFDTTTPRDPATSLRIIAFPLGTQVSNKAVLTSGAISNYEEGLSVRDDNGIIRRFNAIRTEAQATHGSSGGPVVLADTMRVVGVLHGGMNENGFFMNVASDIAQLFNEKNLEIII